MIVLSRNEQVRTFVRTEQSHSGQEKTVARTAESHIEAGRTFWRSVVNRIGLGTVVWRIGGNGSREEDFSSLIASAPVSPVRTGGPADADETTENCNGKWTRFLLQQVEENVHPYSKTLSGSLRKRWRPRGRGFLG